MTKRPGVPTPEDIESCARTLEALHADRTPLAHVDSDLRQRLLKAAGLLSRPQRDEQRALAKAFRRRDRQLVRAADEAARAATGIRAARRAPIFLTPHAHEDHRVAAAPAPGAALRSARKCYVCKAEYREVHFFYDQLCPPCADLNWTKRHQTAPLHGRTALVTGARVKIGYQAAMLLLRAGARVVVTTRFPHDAARRYAAESDFATWRDRLTIHGLDLRHTPSVEAFAGHLDHALERLDFILHNACQTVRRPAGFYAHLAATEGLPRSALSPDQQSILGVHQPRVEVSPLLRLDRGADASPNERGARPGSLDLFPNGLLDQDQQQVDLRVVNSWRLKLSDVPTIELLEVHLVNAVAPFVLSARLKPLMLRQRSFDKHIVNVSAMEGQFYRDHKTDRHPHTNMAKAALNMLTRTAAADFVTDGIHMNSVDTGWVTDEDPAALAERKVDEHGFSPPLDIVDGAARICDPIFSGMITGQHAWGQFFKDYFPTRW